MRFFILIGLLLSSVGFAEPQLELDFGSSHCVDVLAARAVLKDYLGHSPVDAMLEDFPFNDEVETEKLYSAPSDFLAKVLNSVAFDTVELNYRTETVAVGNCAPAADCWGWYVISCNGKIEARTDGED